MPLKTFVKVGKITNLSDARYCSGMGVDILGFEVIENQPAYISPAQYQEIRGWISGPSIAAAIYGITNGADLEKIIANYKPDYLELGEDELPIIAGQSSLPIILTVTPETSMAVLKKWKSRIAYLQVNENDLEEASSLLNDYPAIIELRSIKHLPTLLDTPAKGIALSGGAEIRPGFKDYEELSNVLEALEE